MSKDVLNGDAVNLPLEQFLGVISEEAVRGLAGDRLADEKIGELERMEPADVLNLDSTFPRK